MTMQYVVVDPVRRYAAEVRASLADVSPADLGELADDLDEHLTEVAAELAGQWAAGEGVDAAPDPAWLFDLLVARLGTPSAYAAELRQAAGLPEGDGRQPHPTSAVSTALAWCLFATLLAATPFVLLGAAVAEFEGLVLSTFVVGVVVMVCLAALGVAMRALPTWSRVVAAIRGVAADRPPAGTVTPAVERVATWWLRLLFACTALWLIPFHGDAALVMPWVVPWVGTAVILAVAFGCAPWRAAYTEAVVGLPDPERLRRLRDWLRTHPAGRTTYDYLASLRPAWWLARAWAAVVLVGSLTYGNVTGPLAPLGLTLGLLLVAAVISVWLGIRNRADASWNALTVPGNVVAAIVLLGLLVG